VAFLLEKPKTKTTPYILIDEANGYMKFEGESYLEDIVDFYKDVGEWLEKFLPTDFEKFTFDCAMEYFNSSTSKLLYNIMKLLDKHAESKNIEVNWIVSDEDDDMLVECGEDFREDMEYLKFEVIIGK